MKELDVVRVKKKSNGIHAGAEGTIVPEYDGTHFEVEFVNSSGDTIDVVTTPADVLEPITDL